MDKKLHRSSLCVLSLCLIGSSTITCSCKKNEYFRIRKPAEDSHYLRRSNSNIAVVFVHGIFGDSVSTWTNSKTGAYWPAMLEQDQAFSDADIYVYSFSSPHLGLASTIDELVEQTNSVLAADEVFAKHKRVVFLCHSMGGMIVRGLLRRYRPLAEKVPLIAFYGTPTTGAEITRLGQAMGSLAGNASPLVINPQIQGMLPAESDTYAMILMRDWQAARLPIVSRCAYEEKSTYGVQVVTPASASALCSEPALPIERDHIALVKPTDRDDPIYKYFREAYTSAIVESSVAPSVPPLPRPASASGLLAALVVTRQIGVDCGKAQDKHMTIPFPIVLPSDEHWVDSIVSIQQKENLKAQTIELYNHTDSAIEVRYKILGLDADQTGGCSMNGTATIVAAFLISKPSSADGMSTNKATAEIRQHTNGDFSPAIADVSGNVTIIHAPSGSGPSSLPCTPSSASSSAGILSLATNSHLQGLLLDQKTRGKLSPDLAFIGGSVFIEDYTLPQREPPRK